MQRGAVALTLVLSACAGGPRARPDGHVGGAAEVSVGARVPMRGPSIAGPGVLVPDVDDGASPPSFRRDGASLHVFGGFRVAVHAGHVVERSSERFDGAVDARLLPERFGGGFAFVESTAVYTRLWRAATFTGPLTPLGQYARPTQELVLGLDRFYLRGRYNDLVALDPFEGTFLPRGPLPMVPELGAMAFADGWRGVVDADLRGPLATFDAGASWHPLPVTGAIRGLVFDGLDPVLFTDDGHVRVRADGRVAREVDSPHEDVIEDEGAALSAAARPLGENPLRLAVERGVPDSPSSLVVAAQGAVARVSIPDGRIVELTPRVMPDDAECQGLRVEEGLGFVCSTSGGATVIYRAVKPLGLEVVRRFEEPRRVTSSGNGWLVVRGACGRDATAPRDAVVPASNRPANVGAPLASAGATASAPASADVRRHHCVLDGRGGERDVTVSGEVGTERVIALRDGRTAIVAPPRPGAPAQLSLVRGEVVTSAALVLPTEPEPAAKVAQQGLWLEGMWETAAGTLGGWVEGGGGRLVGVDVALDGRVTLGVLADHGGDTLVSGPLALSLAKDSGYESIDGGKHWKRFVLPRVPDAVEPGTRGCSPGGCSLRGWVRAGWLGRERTDDVREAPAVESRTTDVDVRPSLELTCRARTGKGALPTRATRAEAPPPLAGRPGRDDLAVNWGPFDGVEPPVLAPSDAGVSKGTATSVGMRAQVYAWGPKGADWTKGGSWLVRFNDRFAPERPVKSTLVGRSPWPDLDTAADALGTRPHSGYAQWHVQDDPGGSSALVTVCHPHTSGCQLFDATEGEQPTLLAAFASPHHPADYGAVRLGRRWYFLIDAGPAQGLELWRADATETARVGVIRRLGFTRNRSPAVPTLTRRADERELGLLAPVPFDEADRAANVGWVVFPVDVGNAALGEAAAIDLGSHGSNLHRCAAKEDGWLVELAPGLATSLRLVDASASIDSFSYRMRVDANSRCVDGVTARVNGFVAPVTALPWSPRPGRPAIPLTVEGWPGAPRTSFDCYAP